MFSQPFCLSAKDILVCSGDMFVRLLDTTMSVPCVRALTLPVEMPCIYVGAATSETGSQTVVAETFQSRLILLGATGEVIRQIELPPSMSPKSIARTHDRFWLTIQQGELDTKLGWFDESMGGIQFPEVESGWEPPMLNMVGFPLVLVHHGNLALYNPLAGKLYWLSEECMVTCVKEIPPNAVLGPSASGDLILLSSTDTGIHLYTIDRLRASVPLASMREKPWETAVGICMTADQVLVLDDRGCIRCWRKQDGRWSVVSDCQ